MASTKVNERILEGIRRSGGDDTAITGFLVALGYEEANHPGQWWWKDAYRKAVERWSADWEEGDED